jgi:hypothetical protein
VGSYVQEKDGPRFESEAAKNPELPADFIGVGAFPLPNLSKDELSRILALEKLLHRLVDSNPDRFAEVPVTPNKRVG